MYYYIVYIIPLSMSLCFSSALLVLIHNIH